MTDPTIDSTDPSSRADLRQRAEERLQAEKAARLARAQDLTGDAARGLVHELRVHQIELEMQNESLRENRIALELSQAKYFDLYDLAPVGYFTISKKGIILEANLTGARMLGMDRPQLIGRALGGFISDQDQSQYYAYREKLANHLFASAIQVQMVRGDGSTLHVQLESLVSEAPPEGDDPAPISFRTTLADVSNEMAGKVALQDANRRLETILSQLKSSQEERSKIEKFAVVGQMAAGIAHEFNNMLASILLFTQLSQRSIMGATVEKQTKIHGYLAQTEAETLRAAKMVQSILDFGQRAILDKGTLDLVIFLDDLVHSFRNTLPSTIDCTFSAQEEDAVVWADEGRLRQAIANLTTNAQLAMPDGGEIHFSLTHLAVAHPANAPMPGMKAGQWALVTVTDTGIGMSEKTQAHLFEPFFTTRAPLGSGLGLAQVYGIITQHKGHIHIDSQLGRGTTVTLYLPLADLSQPGGG